MKRNIIIWMAFSIAFLIQSGCAKEEPKICAECDAALDHYYSKLPDNACNPAFMENAVNTAHEKCDGYGPTDLAIYYMAESCCVGDKYFKSSCSSSGYYSRFSVKVMNPLDLKLKDSVRIRLELGIKETYPIGPGQTIETNDKNLYTEGEDVEFTVLDMTEENVLYSEKVKFTYIRPGKVCDERRVELHELAGGKYDFEFYNWE